MDYLAACALVVRAIVATYPHSGMGRPPLHGDLEAQRHCELVHASLRRFPITVEQHTLTGMEVTLHLSIGDWYRNTPENDLMYWGLDYPPLTAFGSWLAAVVGKRVAPQAIAWETSRGAEDASTIAFMRSTVLVADALLFLPTAWLLSRVVAPEPSRMRLFAALAFLPPLIIVDHGHFQYNGVSLGLNVLAVAASARGWNLAAAAAFSFALNYKQMLLYYAPTWFVFLLAESCGPRGSTSTAALTLRRVAALGVVVVLVFALMWLPFCVWADRVDPAFSASSCAAGLGAVLSRLFPFDRSLFEDKVANVWCALEPALKLRERIYADTTGLTRRAAVGAATALTVAMMAPALGGLWCAATRGRLASPPHVEPRQMHDSASLNRAQRPSANGHATNGLRARRTRQGSSSSRSSASKTDWTASSQLAQSTAEPKLDESEEDASTTLYPTVWAPWELLLLALHAVALSFFLASYQVCGTGRVVLCCVALPNAALRRTSRCTRRLSFCHCYQPSCSGSACLFLQCG